MKRVTIICCYNSIEKYNALVKSLKMQSEKCEIIGINNCKQKFHSCSSAFNSIIDSVTTKFVIFSHQDIFMPKENILCQFVDYMEHMTSVSIMGVAGAKKGIRHTITNIRQGKKNNYAGAIQLKGIKKCDTLDECFFGGYTTFFQKYHFNDKICNGWHLYAVEKCLFAKKLGGKVYVCDVNMVHMSTTVSIDHFYNMNFYRLCKAYSKRTGEIWTTCAHSKTACIFRIVSLIKYEIIIRLKEKSKLWSMWKGGG